MNILVVYYYDDYSFLNIPHTPYRPSLTAQSITGYDAVTNGSVKGMLTGQRVYSVSNGYCTFTAFYYDKRGRLVQQRSYNSWSGVDNTYYALSFTGKPLKVRTEQTFSNITTTEEYDYTYDSQERLLATRYKLNNAPIIQLDSFVYDDLGRVSRKYMLDKIDSVSYTYNIRSQITKLKSSGFEENIYYATPPTFNSLVQDLTTPCYNGNVSAATWTYGNKTNGYLYYYDSFNRMDFTYGILDSEWADMYYSENFSYDKQGNITFLYRMNEEDLDMLLLTYEGNQLIKVEDGAYDGISYSAKHYQDYENAQKEMFYDKNGALVADFDRKICTIRNNLLTLPDTIQFSNGNQIVHKYDAMGNRLRTTYYTRKVALVEPATNTIPGTDNLQEYNIVSYAMLGNKRYVRYNDGDWFPYMVINTEGYVKYFTMMESYPYYYIKDHLGSVRQTYMRPTSTNKFLEQEMQYYPSGLPWDTNFGASEQPFKYNGKEFIEMHGLDEYDSEARWYYPAIMRTTSMDPLCEKYYSTSPYAWCGNNPVNFVDPDGRDFVYDKNKGTYEWRDDITRESSIPDGYEYVGGKPDDILKYMGYASTYETQKTSGIYLGFTGGNETLELPLAKGITSGNRIDAEFTLSLRANIELIEENISEYNRAGITFTGISVEANGVLGMDMMNNVYGESIFGVMTLYGMDDNEKATMLRFPQGESLYSTGVLPLSSNIFLPASTLQKGIWPLTTRLEFGYINSSNLLNCSIPKIEWKLLKRTWIR